MISKINFGFKLFEKVFDTFHGPFFLSPVCRQQIVLIKASKMEMENMDRLVHKARIQFMQKVEV